jgi:hypothetical protein
VGLLSSLSLAARLFYPFVQRGVREGISIARIGRAVRAEGFKLANETLRMLVHRERVIWEHGQRLKFVPLGSFVDVSKLPEALTQIRRQFSFMVEVRGTLGTGGQAIIQHVTVASDKPMTRRAILEQAERAMNLGSKRYGIEVSSVELVGGLRAGPAGTL